MSLFKNRPLATASLFLFLGALSAYLLHIGGMTHIYTLIPLFLLGAAPVASLFTVKRTGILLITVLAALFVGYFSQILYVNITFSDIRALDSGKIHQLEAKIIDIEADYTAKSICTVSVVSLNGEPASGKLRLIVRNGEFHPKENDIVSCEIVILEWADGYLYSEGVAAQVATDVSPTVIGKADPTIASTVSAWNSLLRTRLQDGASKETADLLSALLLGERQGLDATITRDFRRAGLSHLLAISGLHLSILAIFILEFLKRIGAPRIVSFTALLVFVAFYAAIAGFPLSLIRAACMLILAELGRLLRLSSDSVTSLFASVALILLVSPGAVADVGLALSFLATLGILSALQCVPKKNAKRSIRRRIFTKLGLAVAVTLAATLFTLLLTVLIFGEISLISPLSNLIISPFLHVILLLAPLTLGFPAIFSPIVSVIADVMLRIVSAISAIHGIYIEVSYLPFILVTILFSILLAVLLVDTHLGKRALSICLLSGFSVLIVTIALCRVYTVTDDHVTYTQANGNEYLILQSDRRVTVVDNGGGAYTASAVKSSLKAEHITEIDTLVITRCTKSSVAFIEALSDAVPVRRILLFSNTSEYAAITKITAEARGIELAYVHNGTQALDGGLSATLRTDIAVANIRDGFLVRLEYGEKRICYAPAAIFSVIDRGAVESFTSGADLVVIGANPDFSGKIGAEGISEAATVLVGNAKSAPEPLFERENTVIEPRLYRYSLK